MFFRAICGVVDHFKLEIVLNQPKLAYMAMTPFTEIDKKNALTKDNESYSTI